ncbi:MAG: endo-1,4-beta-xylanase [Spirochaetales bacterium]|nr:endo-1,4-beta-xylanase [Spirochaetales bacterium]
MIFNRRKIESQLGRRLALCVLFPATLVLFPPLVTQEKTVPADGASLIAGGIEAFRPGGTSGKDAAVETVAVVGQPFTRALRVRTRAKPKNDWDLQAQAKTAIAVKRDDTALAIIWARAVATSDEMGEATLTFVFERAGDPYTKSVQYQMKLNRDWRRFLIPFAVRESYPAGGAQCNLKYGYLPQTIEIGGVEVLTFGRAVPLEDLPKTIIRVRYQGREPDAPWRKAAAERIERYRKADLTVVVRDRRGRPVANAAIAVAMQRHAYDFGAAVTARMLTGENEDSRRYRTIVEENFNKVVFENDLKIGPWEAGKKSAPTANFNMSNTMRALAWCRERGILVRGHTLLWGPLDKRFYLKALGFDIDGGDWERMKGLLLAHLEQKAEATREYVSEWDVINHPVATWGDKGRTWETVLGRGFYADVLHRARALNPGQLLYINEGSDFPGDDEGVRAAYEGLIRDLNAAKAPLDGIGFMSHFGESSLTGMDSVWRLIERYAKFGLKLQSTELDVGTGGDEEGQADYYRDFMTVFFSHPATVGIVLWGFWEGSHWKPDRALWRKNWEIKPCGRVWLDLVKNRWWTNAAGKTGAAGTFETRGFLGDYEITVTAGGKKKNARLNLEAGDVKREIIID